MTTDTRYSRADFQSNQEVKWCPGCGDYTILASVQNFLATLNIVITPSSHYSALSCNLTSARIFCIV